MITPGKVVTTFTTKTGQTATIRYVKADDVQDLLDFINIFSPEDRFTRFAGEQLTFEEEKAYVESELQKMAEGDAVKLFCYVNDKLAGVCDVHRNVSALTRKRHMGIFGLIIGKEFRGQGIGEYLSRTTISEGVNNIPGLSMIQLECFASNEAALTLYKKIGFREVGRMPKALLRKGEYDDEVIMVKETASL